MTPFSATLFSINRDTHIPDASLHLDHANFLGSQAEEEGKGVRVAIHLRRLHYYAGCNGLGSFGGNEDNFAGVELNMGYLGVSALLPHKSSPLQSY